MTQFITHTWVQQTTIGILVPQTTLAVAKVTKQAWGSLSVARPLIHLGGHQEFIIYSSFC